MTDETKHTATPSFLTQWEREDYEREQHGEKPLGPFGIHQSSQDTIAELVKAVDMAIISVAASIAFLARDHNTERERITVPQVIDELAKADAVLRTALTKTKANSREGEGK